MKNTERQIPGAGSGLLLRFSPLNAVLREFARAHSGEDVRLEYLDERRMPGSVKEDIFARGFNWASGEKGAFQFFLKDRIPYRMGLIARRGSRPPREAENWEVREMLDRRLREAGRSKKDFILLSFIEENGIASASSFGPGGRPAPFIAVLWSAERTPLEKLLGSRGPEELPQEWLRRAREMNIAFDPGALLYDEAGEATEEETEQFASPLIAEEVAAEPVESATEEETEHLTSPLIAEEVAAEPVVSAEPVEAVPTPQTVPRPRCDFLGRGPTMFPRKGWAFQNSDGLRLMMLSSPEGLQPAAEARYFDPLRDSTSLVRSHRRLLPGVREVHSLSLEIDPQGGFLCLNDGIPPLLWRAASKRLYILPECRAPAPGEAGTSSVPRKIIKGVLREGDFLLLPVARLATEKTRELEALLQQAEPGQEDALLADFTERSSWGKTARVRIA